MSLVLTSPKVTYPLMEADRGGLSSATSFAREPVVLKRFIVATPTYRACDEKSGTHARCPPMTLTKPEPPERSKIDVSSTALVKRWARALGVTPDQLRVLVGKVGNSASAVRKELETSQQTEDDPRS